MKRLEAAAYSGDLDLIITKTEGVLQEVEPTMAASHFSTQVPLAVANATSKRMRSEPMGSSQPAKKQKIMRATSSTTRMTKASTGQIWGGYMQVGRPRSKKRSAFPKLPAQQPPVARGSAIVAAAIGQVPPTNSYSPLPKKQAKQRVKQVGRKPNLELYAINASAVPSFNAMSDPLWPVIPCAPHELVDRAVYISAWAPIAHTFRQGTQPWHALRAVTCTASNIASFLNLPSSSASDLQVPFSRLFGVQEEQRPSSNSFALQWGVRHELNGVASVLKSFPDISSSMASKLNVSAPLSVSAFEQGLLFVPHTHPLLQETVFGTSHTSYAIAASPDAKLVGDGCELLLEVKCACPYIEKDDGRGWIYSPFKKALGEKGVSVKHFVQCQVQMLAANVPFCLLAGWEVETCKVMCVQFDEDWCRQMLCMLSCILMAAARLSGRPPNFAKIPLYNEFVEFTLKRCEAVTELCSIESVKGDVDGRWL